MRTGIRVPSTLGIALAALAAIVPQAGAGNYPVGAVTIDDSASPPTQATPYPSSVTVTDEQPVLLAVTVRLHDLTHPFPDDIDMLLVGPGGQRAIVLSDAGGATSAVNQDVTIYDEAPGPADDSLSGGPFKPTDVNDGADMFPAPAPALPFATTFSPFNGASPNGTWSLYVVDDTEDGAGTIASWELRLRSRWLPTISPQLTQLSPPNGFDEGVGSVRIRVERSPAEDLRAATVNYSVSPQLNPGQAPTPGQDYLPVSGTLHFSAGETTKGVDIPIIDDAVFESQETVELALSDVTGDAQLPTHPNVMVSIADNDPPPPIVPRLTGAKVQRVLKQRGVVVTAGCGFCRVVVATGAIATPRASTRSVVLRPARRSVRPGQSVRLKLSLTKKGLRLVRGALARRARLKATVRIVANDGLGHQATTSRRISLKR